MSRLSGAPVDDLAGTFVAMVSPFTADNQLDTTGLRTNVEWWISEGVHGLIPAGSAGEFLQLTAGEWDLLVEVTVEAAAGRVPVVVGCSSDATAEVVSRVRRAERAGASGVMVAPPFYSQPTERELIAHYGLVAEASALPIMVYNNPVTTGIDLKPRLLAQLSNAPTVRYVKESTVDVRRVEEILLRTDGRLKVFAGILAFESFLVGATGWVSVPANVLPRLSAELYARTVLEGDLSRGAAINRQLWGIMALEDDTGKYVQIPKEALSMMGRPAGKPRLPRLPLTVEERRALSDTLEELKHVF